jgi:hypothetical protein
LASELARASRLWGEYYVISIESEEVNMSIRKNILITLAVTLIATAPAWSQSLLKTLDPDHDGTVDLAEAKSAASKLFDKLDRDHDGTLDKRELRGRLNAKDFAAADPDNDGTLDKNEFLALVEKRFNAANPDNDGTIDAKELKSAAGRSLARLGEHAAQHAHPVHRQQAHRGLDEVGIGQAPGLVEGSPHQALGEAGRVDRHHVKEDAHGGNPEVDLGEALASLHKSSAVRSNDCATRLNRDLRRPCVQPATRTP